MADDVDDERRPELRLLALAALLALGTVGVVLRFGLVGPPELADVDASTRPAHELAISSYRDSGRAQCIDVVTRDGEVREVRCGLDGGPLLGWDDRGILMLRFASFGEQLVVIDPVTGATLESGPFEDRATMTGRWATVVDVERAGGTLTVRDDDRTVLWQVEAPDAYAITGSARQPDSGTLALLDQAGRLLVLAPGADEPRVWVEDVGARYGELVWQGTTLDAE